MSIRCHRFFAFAFAASSAVSSASTASCLLACDARPIASASSSSWTSASARSGAPGAGACGPSSARSPSDTVYASSSTGAGDTRRPLPSVKLEETESRRVSGGTPARSTSSANSGGEPSSSATVGRRLAELGAAAARDLRSQWKARPTAATVAPTVALAAAVALIFSV